MDWSAPLYLSPPSTASIRAAMRRGELGALLSPAAGNPVPDDALWAADNSAYTGRYPGDSRYLGWLESLATQADRCLWATAPDVVGHHLATWALSRDLLPRIRDLGLPAAYVAQDGMEHDHSSDLWEAFDVLFIGGSTGWKLGPAAAELARVAVDHGLAVHLGRVNSLTRLRYADHLGASTADGTYLTYGPDKLLPTVRRWVHDLRSQRPLF
ncbi:hypothetical protein [Nocardia sp. alder85J]|uniref:hypothetical protein n=1 Tax=Nocardia sp. alder85J TaxID=2862949 RepID=UPI00225511FC|nr:hypothetical protein [Nocardia sp. alder85J]MCX4094514.1 hypothetical protein [Nocardia sp. alder85J]